jgi:anti-sigma factor (TIGR02949 family)
MALFDRLDDSGCGGGEGGRPHSISCEEALRLVHDFLDGELQGVSPAEVKAHFDICRECYPHLRLEQAFREAMKRACSRQTAPPELKHRLERLLSEAGERG